jgi:hypothetical protein
MGEKKAAEAAFSHTRCRLLLVGDDLDLVLHRGHALGAFRDRFGLVRFRLALGVAGERDDALVC